MSNNRYKDILANLEEQPKMTQDDRILLVDGLNLFIRNFTINPSQNDNGVPIGGIKGFLLGLGAAIKHIKPTRVIICFDGKGGSARRRKIYPDYKAGRKPVMSAHGKTFSKDDTRLLMSQQLTRLTDYLSVLPVTVMSTENIEADDAIAYIAKQIYPESNKFIMSTDKDFLQLVDDKCCVWSPTKKVFYFRNEVEDLFGIKPENLALLRAILGDKSDNIAGIQGAGLKTIQKAIPSLFDDSTISIHDIFDLIEQSGSTAKVCQRILDNKDVVKVNYKIMQLYDVEMSGYVRESLMNITAKPVQSLNIVKFIQMLTEDSMFLLKNLDLWLRMVWVPIDALRRN